LAPSPGLGYNFDARAWLLGQSVVPNVLNDRFYLSVSKSFDPDHILQPNRSHVRVDLTSSIHHSVRVKLDEWLLSEA
jgi:hypothetical protein